MAQSSDPSPTLAVRSSEGISLCDVCSPNPTQVTISSVSESRVLKFSPDGGLVAICDGKSVRVRDIVSDTEKCTFSRPKTRQICFSPLGTYIALWEPYTITKDNPTGSPNLQIFNTSGELVAEYIQKKQQGWCPQWTDDEQLCARNVTNEVHYFNGGAPGPSCDGKLQIAGLASFSLSLGKPPYKVAVYIPGTKGAPSFVRLFQHPNLNASAIMASRSFFRADTVNFHWNKKGSAVLVVTTTEVDKTGASYYGEQGLHYLSSKGDGIMVQLSKKGPIYEVEWNPNSEEFCVVYGFMPGKATIFNCKCESVYDFGTGHRNMAKFNQHGSILCLAGFGNLRGNMELWNREKLNCISKPQASDSTQFEWCPDGVHFVTATTAPRLRVGNGYKLWHISGTMIQQWDTPPKQELWEVKWRPCPTGTFPTPDTSAAVDVSQQKPAQEEKKAAYRPPALRGKPYTYKLHEEELPQTIASESETDKGKLSKSALKNKRKKEARQKANEQEQASSRVGMSGFKKRAEQEDALALASHLMASSKEKTVTAPVGNERGDNEKKLKNLRKKLQQIEQLKQQQLEGKNLEANQLEKIKNEQTLQEELRKLTV